MSYRAGQLLFALANGWKCAPGGAFSLKTLARGGVSDRRNEWPGWMTDATPDHAEYFRKDRRAVAIVGHNYDGGPGTGSHYGTDDITEIAKQAGLVVQLAPAGKAASWYYPGACTLLVITRPGIEIVWPTPAQMAASKRADDAEEQRWRNSEARRKARLEARPMRMPGTK